MLALLYTNPYELALQNGIKIIQQMFLNIYWCKLDRIITGTNGFISVLTIYVSS